MNWIDPYLEQSELLRKLYNWFQEGKSDEWIAHQWQVGVDKIHNMRCRWGLFRPKECPDCGDQRYDGVICVNNHCFSVWTKKLETFPVR